MPLNFNLSDVHKRLGDDDFEIHTTHPHDLGKPIGEKRWHPVSDALIWLSMSCGYHEITEANALQIARRIATYEKRFGASLRGGNWVEIPITIEDVWHHIGLGTNATVKTKSEFERAYGPLCAPTFGPSANKRCAEVFAKGEE